MTTTATARTTATTVHHKMPSKEKAPRRLTKKNLLSEILASPSGREFLTTVALGRRSRLTLMDAVIPPGTFLEILAQQIYKETDLPVEIAVAVFMSQLTAAMAGKSITVSWEDDPAHPAEMALWMLVLAPSGAGKTLLKNLICEALDLTIDTLPEPGSASAFLGGLSALGGTALWCRDEYGQVIKQMKDGGQLAPLRGHLLQAYDHGKLENSTITRGTVSIEHPVLSIYGSTVDVTFRSCVDAEMLSDGLLARHLFIVAERRPLEVPRYRLAPILSALSTPQVSQSLRARIFSEASYVISTEAALCYEQLWKELAKSIGDGIDPAYFRRTTWAIMQYAVVFHLLLGEAGPIIKPISIRWAWRMVMLHIQYARDALVLCDPGFAVRLEKMIFWVEQQAHAGADIMSSVFVRKLLSQFKNDIKSASDARQIIGLVARKSSF